jgi:hypothetical protein
MLWQASRRSLMRRNQRLHRAGCRSINLEDLMRSRAARPAPDRCRGRHALGGVPSAGGDFIEQWRAARKALHIVL